MCDEVAEDSLGALKFPDWLVTSKMIPKLYTALYTENILYFNEDSGYAIFFVMKWVFLV